MISLSNEKITIQVAEKGAELKSLVRNADGREYMWQADPAYWARTAPVLFPLVGSVKNKEFKAKGKTYPMGQHGFARDTDFTLTEKGEDYLTFTLLSNEETLVKYPYDFKLEITYKLSGSSVKTIWKVTNPAEEALYFSLGGHPAFNCQMSGYSFALYEGDGKKAESFPYYLLGEGGLVVNKEYEMKLADGRLPIRPDLFKDDALILPSTSVRKVALVDPNGEEYLSVFFDTQILGLWSPAGKKAPFVCIEPWYGLADWEDADGIWENRRYANVLASGQTFEGGYSITV